MPSVLDLELRFDDKENKFLAEIRMVWKCQNKDIDIVKGENERVELGIFGTQLDPETTIGVRVVIGKDRNEPAVSDVQKTHVTVSVSWPMVVCACDNIKVEESAPLFAPTPLPLSLLFPSSTKLKYILPKDNSHSRSFWPKDAVRVPVGNLDHLN
ncbi:15408_t:CDS:2, partial [Acaulospora colombiana]